METSTAIHTLVKRAMKTTNWYKVLYYTLIILGIALDVSVLIGVGFLISYLDSSIQGHKLPTDIGVLLVFMTLAEVVFFVISVVLVFIPAGFWVLNRLTKLWNTLKENADV